MKTVLFSKMTQIVSLFIFLSAFPIGANGVVVKQRKELKHLFQKEQKKQSWSGKMEIPIKSLTGGKHDFIKAIDEETAEYPDSLITYTATGKPLYKTEYEFNAEHMLVRKIESAASGDGTWDVVGDYKTGYDDDGRPVYNENYETNDQGILTGIFKASVRYDAYGNQVYKEQFQWDQLTNVWNNFEKSNSEYRADGQLIYEEEFYWNGTSWEGSSRDSYTYNESGMPTKYEDFEWEDGKWTVSFYSISEYDEAKPNNLMVKTEYEADNENETREMSATAKAFYSYNEKDEKILVIWKKWDGEDWVNDEKYQYEYTNGKSTSEECYSWNGDIWILKKKWEGSFDSQGRELTALFYYPDSEGSELVLTSKYTHAFDENGNNILDQIEMIPLDGVTKELILMQKIICKFDEASRATLYEAYAYNYQTGYGGVKKEVSEYTGYGNNQRFYKSYKWDAEAKGWVNDMKEEYTYNDHHLMTECLRSTGSATDEGWTESEKYDFMYTKSLSMERRNYSVKDAAENWVMEMYALFFYPVEMNITTVESDGLNLFVSGNNLSFSGIETDTRISIYDFAGKLVKSVLLSDDMLRLTLPQGMYVVKAGNRSIKILVK